MRGSSRRARWIAAAAASCAAAAAVVATALPASAAQSTPTSQSVVVVNCAGKLQVEPTGFILTCADDGDYLSDMQWVSWGNVAFGSATEHIENCYPSCASSSNRWYSYPVLVTLWRAKPLPGHAGQDYFTRLTEIRTGSLKLPHDPNLSRTYTQELAAWPSTGS